MVKRYAPTDDPSVCCPLCAFNFSVHVPKCFFFFFFHIVLSVVVNSSSLSMVLKCSRSPSLSWLNIDFFLFAGGGEGPA